MSDVYVSEQSKNEKENATLRLKAEIRDGVNALAAELGLNSQNEVLEYLLSMRRQANEAEDGRVIPNLDVFGSHLARLESIFNEAVRMGWDTGTGDIRVKTGHLME